MTTAPLRPLFGQVLGQAQRAAAEGLARVLADRGTTFEHWVALNALAQGPGVPAPPPDPGALADLVAAGLIAVRLSPAGERRHAELRAAIADYSTVLLAGIPEADVETTRGVLESFTANAAQ